MPVLPSDEGFDLIVLGAGGAGLAAALFGAIEGLQNPHHRAHRVRRRHHGIVGGLALDSRHRGRAQGEPCGYALHRRLPICAHAAVPRATNRCSAASWRWDRSPSPRSNGAPKSICARSNVTRIISPTSKARPHAGACSRPCRIDGRQLGADIDLIRPPIEEFTLMGGMMVDRADIGHLLNATRSLQSFRHAARTGGAACGRCDARPPQRPAGDGQCADRPACWPRLQKRGVPIWRETEVLALIGRSFTRDRRCGQA